MQTLEMLMTIWAKCGRPASPPNQIALPENRRRIDTSAEPLQPARMNVVLVEPEIPPNTGNVARLCAATRTRLHLIEPFGFKLDDAALKRAGMDYWEHVEWRRWPNWAAFDQ